MIPDSVELTDFLSHRCAGGEPVVFDFDGAVLWSVSGDNGAGKSAIFDAITWTLFNEHRGGSQDAKRLISHGADRCRAAFTFTLGGERYRVERSLRRRGSAKRAAARWDPDAEVWREIPETSGERGFERWRDETIGLSHAAFTQSVLLLQGDSDRLIRAGSKDRFEILAELVDLSSYRALEDLARERASEARGRRNALKQDLAGLSPVDPDERRAATAEVERLGQERTVREELRQAQAGVVAAATEHERLAQRLAATRAEIEVGEKLAASAGEIRARATEATALSAAKPILADATAALTAAGHAAERAAVARQQLDATDVERLERAAETAEGKAAKASAAAGEADRRAVELAKLLPAAETLVLRRCELAEIEAALERGGTSAEAKAALTKLERTIAKLKRGLDEAREVEREVTGRLSVLEAAVARLGGEVAEIRAGDAEAVCSRCGQEVPEGQREDHLAHAESELAERSQERDATRAALEALATARAAAERDVEDRAAERSRLELVRASAAEQEKARTRLRRSVAAARRARTVAGWDDERAALLRDGPPERLERLLEDLLAERERLAAAAERAAGDDARARDETTAAAKAVAAARERQAALESILRRAEDEATGERRRAEIELDRLPDDWARRARAGEPGLAEQLDERLAEVRDAPTRRAELDAAETRLTELRGAARELDAQLAEVPPEHRVSPETAEAELGERRAAVEEIARLAEQAQAQLRDLDRRDDALSAAREDLQRVERAERLATRMSVLLGRQGLQGQLLAHAARSLEKLANETLHALTGGTLSLEIRPDERRNRDEITISARDYGAGGERTDAAFLSGSEKFRVCVAMAAAIGKYSSGRATIESLIVDEGFGSLDEAGRDEMIDELQRLAQLLERVIVVSHQGEFHDRTRFPHGYRLHRDDGSTAVERFL